MENAREMKTTLVLGGTSKTGCRVVKRLEARGLPVRVGSRSGEPPFDWEDRSTWDFWVSSLSWRWTASCSRRVLSAFAVLPKARARERARLQSQL